MKFSEQWLRTWTNPSISSATLMSQLTMAGLEVEQFTPVADEFTGVVIGEIVAVEKHPQADKLHICEVDIGVEKNLTIVCGASKVVVGMRVPVACIGSLLPNNLKIKKAKLRGVESEGMLCTAKELGLAENSEGLMEFSDTATLGQDVRHYLQLDDLAIEIKITPNRGDCLSIAGIAREVAVLNQSNYHMPEIHAIAAVNADQLSINVTAPKDCPTYVGRVIRDINLSAETPIWLQERLRRSGVRSINPVVDVTNYVMLEVGQPMHAFDLALINSEIQVRPALPQEPLTLLDGRTLNLTESSLVVADKHRVLALAGVMGGLESGVNSNTKDIFLESAHFTPQIVAQSARKHYLSTDSSYRFERGVDPQLPMRAMERATALLLEIVGGKVGPITKKEFPEFLPQVKKIKFRPQRVEKVLGINVADSMMLDIFQRLGFQTENKSDYWLVTAPSYRFDIAIEEDLIEEVARIYGYEKLPTEQLHAAMSVPSTSEDKLSVERITTCLIDRGFQEVITYSFVDPNLQKAILIDQELLTLLNPISAELSQMRSSLWPGLITALQYNQARQQSSVRLFEHGLRFIIEENVLQQQRVLSGLIAGDLSVASWNNPKREVDFYDLKADVAALIALSKQSNKWIYQADSHPALHPKQAAKIICEKGNVLGWLGALHPATLQQLELSGPVFLFELQLDQLEKSKKSHYQPISKFPLVRRDLSFTVDEQITAKQIYDAVYCSNFSSREFLREVCFFDIYKGEGIEKGKKSVAISLALQHPTRTLVDTEVNDYVAQVIAKLIEDFQIKLRN